METPVKYRAEKWRVKQRAAGKKQITVWLSGETRERLEREQKNTGKTLSEIIDRLLQEQLKSKKKREIIKRE